MKGILLETLCTSSMVRGTCAVPAMARKCSTPFVLPPSAIVKTKAFSKDSFVSSFRGVISCSIHILMYSAALAHSRILAGLVAGLEEEPGIERPMASIAVDIVFAVYIPPHAPAPGHDFCSSSSMISSCVRPGCPAPSLAFNRLYAYAPSAS